MFAHGIEFQEESLRELIETLRARRSPLEKLFAALDPSDDEEHERLSDEAAEINAWLNETAEIVMVATHHWVERELKVLAAWLSGQSLARTNLMNSRQLGQAFASAGYDLGAAKGHAQVDVFRLFANSWKHNALVPSPQLLKALRLPSVRGVHGLLQNRDIEQALRNSLSLTIVDATCFDVAGAMPNHAGQFLRDVNDHAPLK